MAKTCIKMGPREAGTAPWGAAGTCWHPGTPPGHPRDPRVFPGSFEAIKLLPMVGKPKDSNTLDRQKGSADFEYVGEHH